jgi:hypothetical protein
MKHTFNIPGFSRYVVAVDPFRIVNAARGRSLRFFPVKGKQCLQACLTDDDKRNRRKSILYFAALAFHGQPPAGWVAHLYGDEIWPGTVEWLPAREAKSLRQSRLTERQQMEALEWYYECGLSQAEVARRLGVDRYVIRYLIKRYVRERHEKAGAR